MNSLLEKNKQRRYPSGYIRSKISKGFAKGLPTEMMITDLQKNIL